MGSTPQAKAHPDRFYTSVAGEPIPPQEES